MLLASLGAQAQPVTWLGGDVTLPYDWNTAINWSGNALPTSANNVLMGTVTAVNTPTIDLGGNSVTLSSSTAPNNITNAVDNNAVYAFEFGTAGGNNYTVQNGSVTLNTTNNTYVKLGAGVTANLNVSTLDANAKIYELRNNSTLNINGGTQASGSAIVYGGTNSTTTATLNLNAANYGNAWYIGNGNAGSTSITSGNQNLTVNFNANQTFTSPIIVGWTAPGYENRLVVRNGATLSSTTGAIRLGLNASSGLGTSIGSGRLVIGEATTTGTVNLSYASGTLRVGGGGSTGTVDIVNGTLSVSGTGTAGLLPLAYGGAGGQGVINIYSNGLLNVGASITNSGSAGSGIINFNGGTLRVGSGSTAARRTNLVDVSVAVNVLDGGAIFDMNGATDTAIKAALLNGGTGVGAVSLTNSTGTGKITFAGANSYQGGTIINAGTLALANAGTLGNTGGTLTLAGGSLDLGGSSQTVGAVTNLSGNITNGTLTGTTYQMQAGTTYANLAGSGVALTKTGTGTNALAGTNTYTGGTFVNGGTLQIGANGTSGSVTGNISLTNDATLAFKRSDSLAYNGNISGPGNITKIGAGALTLGGTITLSATNSGGNTFSVDSGTLELNSSSSCNFTNARLRPFVSGINSVTISGGNHLFAGAAQNHGITIGNNSGLTVSGGAVSTTQLVVGNGNSGAYTQSGGTNTVTSGSMGVELGVGGTNISTATVNLNGGLLVAQKIAAGQSWLGTGTINLNGGIFRSSATEATNLFQTDSPNSLPGSVNVQVGGAIVDTAGFSAVCTNALLADLTSPGGGLTKLGAGGLTLTGANTYTGPTVVSNGTLLVNGSLAAGSSVTIISGATLGGSGAVNGAVSANNGGTVTPGTSALGTLTINNNLVLQSGAGAFFRLNITNSPATNDFLVVTGTQSISGSTLTVTNLGPALNAGDSFKLLSNTAGAAGFTTLNLPSGYTWTNKLAIDGSIQVLTVVSGTPSPTNITCTVSGSQLVLNWPAGQGWVLQSNSVSLDSSNSWFNVTGATPPATNTVDASKTAVFFRLKY